MIWTSDPNTNIIPGVMQQEEHEFAVKQSGSSEVSNEVGIIMITEEEKWL